jgi:hypothetical protein
LHWPQKGARRRKKKSHESLSAARPEARHWDDNIQASKIARRECLLPIGHSFEKL